MSTLMMCFQGVGLGMHDGERCLPGELLHPDYGFHERACQCLCPPIPLVSLCFIKLSDFQVGVVTTAFPRKLWETLVDVTAQ